MLSNIKEQLKQSIQNTLDESFPSTSSFPSIELEHPNEKIHGDFACNIAMRMAKPLKQNPIKVAEQIVSALEAKISTTPLKDKIQKIEVKKPGFINFFLTSSALFDVIAQVQQEQENYGRLNIGQNKKVQIEFVSANPTGPLSVAHARQAAVGDALARILRFIGFDAQKEYYVNDEGNQINLLGESIVCRIKESFGETVELPEGGYQGEYVKDIARRFIEDNKIEQLNDLDKIESGIVSQYGVEYLMKVIREDLDGFGVHFDIWSHQSEIATKDAIQEVLADFRKKGFVYEKEGASWFQSTTFGDDKDRVVVKSDKSYTYLTPDIVYHKDKFKRGFQTVINIWGPDHHGYIPRIKAAAEALGKKSDDLKVLIVQLATIYRAGKPLSMSTRRGEFISLREVLDEVGADAARFFFLMRHINVHLDFDLELAKKETPENPVFYIQYAHARIHSIEVKAGQADLKVANGVTQLNQPEELELIKTIGCFSDMLLACFNQLDPFALVNYLQDLAAVFHRFYDRHRVVDASNSSLSGERLALVEATKTVLANGLTLLGLSTPKRM